MLAVVEPRFGKRVGVANCEYQCCDSVYEMRRWERVAYIASSVVSMPSVASCLTMSAAETGGVCGAGRAIAEVRERRERQNDRVR